MVSIRKGRLSINKQDRLLEHFIGGTTACCTASFFSVNFKTSVFYFHKLREIIAYHLELEIDTVFMVRLNLMKVTLAAIAKNSVVVVPPGKSRYLGF